MARRLGRTILLTNRLDWTADQVIAGYDGQQHIEQVFRGLKDGDWLGWGTDVSLDRQQDSRARVLLLTRSLASADGLSGGASRVARPLHGAAPRRTRTHPGSRPAL